MTIPILLPPSKASGDRKFRRNPRILTLLGGNGSGKSLFLDEIRRLNPADSYMVSAVTGSMPAKATSSLKNLMTVLSSPEEKARFLALKETWEEVFTGNRIRIENGKIRITNRSGKDSIGLRALSRGEKAALYYIAATLMAPEGGLILVDSPTLFLHPTVAGTLWDRIERLRADCRFVYDTYDANFAAGQAKRIPLWIKDYNAADHSWDYQMLTDGEIPDDLFLEMMGSRRPILFTEGDTSHSIDMRLYSVVFPEFTVKPLGSCDKVIESTRTMQSLKTMHRIESFGLVDRDRRSEAEVEYLRAKNILVPEVAEIENIFLSSGVVGIMAEIRHRNPVKIIKTVRREVMHNFEQMLESQALQHTRHRMKRDVERKIDARFTCITALELHIKSLIKKLKPRETYDRILAEFRRMARGGDFEGVLRVFNHKPLLTGSAAPKLLGFSGSDDYITGVISVLKHNSPDADRLRNEIRKLFS